MSHGKVVISPITLVKGGGGGGEGGGRGDRGGGEAPTQRDQSSGLPSPTPRPGLPPHRPPQTRRRQACTHRHTLHGPTRHAHKPPHTSFSFVGEENKENLKGPTPKFKS